MGRHGVLSSLLLLSLCVGPWAQAKTTQELFRIIKCGTYKELKAAFESREETTKPKNEQTDPNGKTKEGLTPALYAAQQGETSMLLYLVLKQKANLRATDQDGRTVLHLAVMNKRKGVVQILANKLRKEDPKGWQFLINAKDDMGLTAFHWAVQRGYTPMAAYLLRFGANPLTPDANGKTALYWAVKKDRDPIVKLLLKGKKLDVNHKNKWGITALHRASKGGYVDIMSDLVDAGANVNVQDLDGRTPLFWASERGHAKAVAYLLKKRADPNILNYDKRSPLHRAARYGHADVAKQLVEKGKVDVNIQDPLKETPFCWAVRNGYVKTARVLYSLGAQMEYLTQGAKHIFHEIAQKGYRAMMNFLIKKGHDVDVEDENGKTALHHAAEAGKAKTVAFLLKKKADYNKRDKDGKVPLHYASKAGHSEVIQVLLSREGSNVHIKDSEDDAEDAEEEETLDEEGSDALTDTGEEEESADKKEVAEEEKKDSADEAKDSKGKASEKPEAGKSKEKKELKSSGDKKEVKAEEKSSEEKNKTAEKAGAEDKKKTKKLKKPESSKGEDDKKESSKSAIQYAAENKQIKAVETILNSQRNDKENLLKLIQDNNLDLYDVDSSDKTVFDYAIKKKHIKLLAHLALEVDLDRVMKILNRKKANLDTLDSKDGLALLHYSALLGREELAKALLGAGASVDVLERGTALTPLHYAILEKSTAVAKVLVDKGALPGAMAKDLSTPFMTAIKQQDVEVVKMLLRAGADPWIRYGDYKPFDLAMQTKNTQILELFMNHFKNDQKKLRKFDREDILRKMVDKDGMTVIHWASKEGHSALLTILFDISKTSTRPYIAGTDKDGRTALHYAAAGGYPDIVDLLLWQQESGLAIDALTDKERRTALHEAAMGQQMAAVKMLLEYGAAKGVADKDKKLALDYLEGLDKKQREALEAIVKIEEPE